MISDLYLLILGKKKALYRAVVRGQSLLTYACFLLSLYVIEFVEIRNANSELKVIKTFIVLQVLRILRTDAKRIFFLLKRPPNGMISK